MSVLGQWKTRIIGTLVAMVLGLVVYSFTAVAGEVSDLSAAVPVNSVKIEATATRLDDHIKSDAERNEIIRRDLERLNAKMDVALQELAAIRGRSIATR